MILRHNLRTALVAAATMAAATVGAANDAAALTYRDILGNWCSATARLEFTREAMGVFKFADKARVKNRVSRYEFSNAVVIVHWYDGKNLTSSDFGEFSADGRSMFLQP